MLEPAMFRTSRFRIVALAICGLTFVACAGSGAPAVVQPTAAPPTPAATPAAQSNDSVLQTVMAMPTAVQATPDLPAPIPTITVGPTAAPFPLQAGWWDDAVCYEVFVRSFYDSDGNGIGDINGLIQKLDYLND